MLPIRNPKGVDSLPVTDHKHTGLVCPECELPVAVFDYERHDPPTHDVWLKCPACGHRWGVSGTPPTGTKIVLTKDLARKTK